MKKQINDYLKDLENNKVDKKDLLVKISFYQHERLIHLIVTCLVAISAILFTFVVSIRLPKLTLKFVAWYPTLANAHAMFVT